MEKEATDKTRRSAALKKSLSETLTQFYPLAGTIKSDLSIDCNDVCANYVVALVRRRLDEFLEHPNHGLINTFLPFKPSFSESSAGKPVTNVQVNIFECGGIAVGLCVSHKIVDGAALHTFLKGWTNMARGAQEVVYPNLTAPSLFPAKRSMWLKDVMVARSRTLIREGNCCTTPHAIARLQARAAGNGVNSPTRVEAVSGFIWKCVMAASKEAHGVQKPSRLSHLKSLIEMGDVNSLGSIENYSFTSWCKMGFYELDFGFGKPSWVTGPIADGAPFFINIVTLMDTKCGKGIEAWVNLDETEMEILQKNQDLLAYASVDPSPLVPDEVGAFVRDRDT
ncbi:hypothetical protein L2E82_36206 [Cichorium intybus]|uniref:Uncharacterized protein n=1 Tax=Cichorium intybus TaxID=13427 RepID=A0ACB9BQW8_CICIN|nr:hypothetical protein L2E82_36206 [Cichorium intybus]